MKKLLGLVLCMALAAPFSVFAVGAIAVDDEVGDTEPGYGIATGYDTKEEAKKAALKNCRNEGNENCKVSVWFEGCGAYASSKKYSGAGWGKSKRIAEAKALETCGSPNCKIQASECDE